MLGSGTMPFLHLILPALGATGETEAWPYVAGRDHRGLLRRRTLERTLDVFGIPVLAAGRDDHVLAAADEMKVLARVERAEVARAQPTVVRDGLRRSRLCRG